METQQILDLMRKPKSVQKVESQLFEVVKKKLHTADPIYKTPEMYGIFKSTGEPLANKSMGKEFSPMQPSEFLDNILTTVYDFGANLDIKTLQFREFCGGSKIEFSIKMKSLEFLNSVGVTDKTNISLTFSTSYDGSKANKISLFTERLLCSNGMVAKNLQGELKGKSTAGGKAKILSYSEEVAKMINGTEDFKLKMLELNKKRVNKEQIQAFKLQLLGYNEDTVKESGKDLHHTRETILNGLNKGFEIEFPRSGQTLFGLLQGVTYYTNHLAENDLSKGENVRFGKGLNMNNKAQELIFEMV
jgi:hypothetical protein